MFLCRNKVDEIKDDGDRFHFVCRLSAGQLTRVPTEISAAASHIGIT